MCRRICDSYKNIYVDINKREKINNSNIKLDMIEFFDKYKYNTSPTLLLSEILNDNDLKHLFIKINYVLVEVIIMKNIKIVER